MATETKANHSKGPWRVGTEGFRIYSGASAVAEVPGLYSHVPQIAEANARLIAAAPGLLEAAEAVLEWAKTPGDHGGNPYCKEFVRLAEAAVQAAKGA